MTASITSLNAAGVSDWAPSQSAAAGLLCTSIIRPSAPAAVAAIAIGFTRPAIPVAWLGSTMIGRCVIVFRSGMDARSRVFLVAVSNVLMPRSQRMILLVAACHDVFGAHQQLLQRAGKSASSAGSACLYDGRVLSAVRSSACFWRRPGSRLHFRKEAAGICP